MATTERIESAVATVRRTHSRTIRAIPRHHNLGDSDLLPQLARRSRCRCIPLPLPAVRVLTRRPNSGRTTSLHPQPPKRRATLGPRPTIRLMHRPPRATPTPRCRTGTPGTPGYRLVRLLGTPASPPGRLQLCRRPVCPTSARHRPHMGSRARSPGIKDKEGMGVRRRRLCRHRRAMSMVQDKDTSRGSQVPQPTWAVSWRICNRTDDVLDYACSTTPNLYPAHPYETSTSYGRSRRHLSPLLLLPGHPHADSVYIHKYALLAA